MTTPSNQYTMWEMTSQLYLWWKKSTPQNTHKFRGHTRAWVPAMGKTPAMSQLLRFSISDTDSASWDNSLIFQDSFLDCSNLDFIEFLYENVSTRLPARIKCKPLFFFPLLLFKCLIQKTNKHTLPNFEPPAKTMCLSAPPPPPPKYYSLRGWTPQWKVPLRRHPRQQLQPETHKAKYACIIEIGGRRGGGGGAWGVVHTIDRLL